MKTSRLFIILLTVILYNPCAKGQTTYTYPLSGSFSSLESGGPALIQIPNNSGLYGEFTTRTVPASTCGQGGTAGGYFFEDDAGLQFNNPEGFIDQSYSLAFNFQVDEFITPPSWVRILSFTHIDDIGVYIYLTNPPENGTLEFWPYGTVGEYDFFNTLDFYQLILVRNNEGLIRIYINGQNFAEYDDSETQKFLPGDPDNFIVFFRDDPSVLANEASPGFVSGLIITDFAWSEQQVKNVWDNFCSSLLQVPESQAVSFTVYPNPAVNNLNIMFESNQQESHYRILDAIGRLVIQGLICKSDETVDISMLDPGLYLVVVEEGNRIRTGRFMKE